MARLTLTLSDLYTKVSNFLSITDTGTAPTDDTELATCKDIVYRGYRQFLYPIDTRTGQMHEWSFLKQFYSFNTVSGKWKYALPANFSDFLDNPHFDDTTGYKELRKVLPEQILESRANIVVNQYPLSYAIAPYTYDNSTGTFYEMWLDPEPDGVYLLKFFYRIDPLKPENDTDYLVGGIRATEAILENCLAVAEQQEDDTIGIHTQLAADLTQKLIISDIQEESDFIGNLSWRKDRFPSREEGSWTADTTRVYEGDDFIDA